MAEIGQVYVTVGAKIDDLKKALTDAKAQLGGVADEAGKTETATGSLWKEFVKGQIATVGLSTAFNALKGFLTSSIDASAEAEKAQRGLDSAIEITRGNVPGLSSALKDYASELQKTTVFEDDAVIAAESLLVQLTDLDEKGLREATRGAIGLSSVFGMDLQSSARLVAAAMEGNYDKLARYIPAIKDAKTESEKHSIAMDGLAKMYQRAEADTGTYTGKMAQLKNAFGDMKETIGDFITQNESFRTGIGLAQGVIETFTNGLRYMSTHGMDYSLAQQAAIEKVLAFKDSLQVLKPSMDEMREAVEGGRDKWEAYKERVTAADSALASNKGAIISWMETGLRKLGLLDELAEKTGNLNDAYAALGLKARDVAEVELAKMIRAFNDVKTADPSIDLEKTAEKIVDMADAYGVHLDPAIRAIALKTENAKAAQEAFNKSLEEAGIVVPALGQDIDWTRQRFVDYWVEAQRAKYATDNIGSAAEDASKKVKEHFDSMRPPVIDFYGTVEEETDKGTANVSTKFDDLMRDITTGWADSFQGMVEGTKSFSDFLNETWGAIKKAFFRLIADMVSGWVGTLIKELTTAIKGGAKTTIDAIDGITGAAAKSTSSMIGSFASLATSVGFVGLALYGLYDFFTAKNNFKYWHDEWDKAVEKTRNKYKEMGLSLEEINELLRKAVETNNEWLEAAAGTGGRGGTTTPRDDSDSGKRRGGGGYRDRLDAIAEGFNLIGEAAEEATDIIIRKFGDASEGSARLEDELVGHSLTTAFKAVGDAATDAMRKALVGLVDVNEAAGKLGVTTRSEMIASLKDLEAAFRTLLVSGDWTQEGLADGAQKIADAYKELGWTVPEQYQKIVDAAKPLVEVNPLQGLIDATKKLGVTTRSDLVASLDELWAAYQTVNDSGEFTFEGQQAAAKKLLALYDELGIEVPDLLKGFVDVGNPLQGLIDAAKIFGVTMRADAIDSLTDMEAAYGTLLDAGEFTSESQLAAVKKIAAAYEDLGQEVPEQFQKILDSVALTAQEIDKLFGDATKGFGKMAANITPIEEEITELRDGLTELSETVAKNIEGYETFNAAGKRLEEISPILGGLKARQEELTAALKDSKGGAGEYGKLQTQLEKVGGTLDEAKEKQDELTQALEGSKAAWEGYNELQIRLESVKGVIKETEDKQAELTEALRGAKVGADEYNKLQTQLGKVGVTLDDARGKQNKLLVALAGNKSAWETYNKLQVSLDGVKAKIKDAEEQQWLLNRALSKTEKGTEEYKKLQGELETLTVNLHYAKNEQESLQGSMANVKSSWLAYDSLQDQISGVTAAITEAEEEQSKLTIELVGTEAGSKEYSQLEEEIKKTKDAIQAAKNEQESLQASIAKVKDGWAEYNSLQGKIEAVSKSIGDAESEQARLTRALATAKIGSEEYVRLQEELNGVDAQLKETQGTYDGLISEQKKYQDSFDRYTEAQAAIGQTEEALAGQLETAQSMNAELDRLGRIALATFNGMIASGTSVDDALEAMQEPLSVLSGRYDNLGLTGNAAIQQLLHISDVRAAHTDLFEAIDGNNEVLTALGSLGILTAETLADITGQATAYYERLQASGLTAQEALGIMAPSLVSIQGEAAKYGLAIDANTQSLIDQAGELGILTTKSADPAEKMGAAFDKFISDFSGPGGVIDKMAAAITTATGKVSGLLDVVKTPTAMDIDSTELNDAIALKPYVTGLRTSVQDPLTMVVNTTALDTVIATLGTIGGKIDAIMAEIITPATIIINDGALDGTQIMVDRIRETLEEPITITVTTNWADDWAAIESTLKTATDFDAMLETAEAMKAKYTPQSSDWQYWEDRLWSLRAAKEAAGFAEGGIAWEPQLAMVAEHEPEIIIPLSKYNAGASMAAASPVGGGAITFGAPVVNIYAQRLDDMTINTAAEKIYAAMKREAVRQGA